jgi:hypothetical protein
MNFHILAELPTFQFFFECLADLACLISQAAGAVTAC